MKTDFQNIPLDIIDGMMLSEAYREILQPGEIVTDTVGNSYNLPRYFFEIDSEDCLTTIKFAQNFSLWEFIQTDYKEHKLLQDYPRYLPIATVYMASFLELVRKKVGTTINIAVNGGYRSPEHKLNTGISPHAWGTAVNIHKIGNTLIDNKQSMNKYIKIIHSALPGVWVRPFGLKPGKSFDQLHMDFGFTSVYPKHTVNN